MVNRRNGVASANRPAVGVRPAPPVVNASENICGCPISSEACGCSPPTEPERPPPGPAHAVVRRLSGSLPALRLLERRSRQLAVITEQCTFYEHHEVVDASGQVIERRERGEPFVYKRELGLAPIDPHLPFLEDGSAVSRTTLGYTDAQGRWNRVVRYQRLPGPGPAVVVQREGRPRRMAPGDRARTLARLRQDLREPLPVAIVLHEQQPAHRLLPRSMTGPAFAERHRQDTLSPRRRKLRAENHERRVREAGPLRAWIRSVGGTLGHHATVYGSILSAEVPRAKIEALLARPEVARVEVRVTEAELEGFVTDSYLCTNEPVRWDSSRDSDASSCEPEVVPGGDTTIPTAYMDAANAAMGALAYVDAGYTGLTGGGLSNWGHHVLFSPTEHPTLTYGISDPQSLAFDHPAFLSYGRRRVQYILDQESSGAELRVWPEPLFDAGLYFDLLPSATAEDGHATRCAAVAMANSHTREDRALRTDEARGARSGIARGVTGLAAMRQVQVYEMLDVIASGTRLGTGEDGQPLEGIDVISSSAKEGHGDKVDRPDTDDPDDYLRCASEDDARGLDIGSLAVVYAFANDDVVFAKAGGNDHGLLSACPSPSVTNEISAPGASAAAISSAALETVGMTAAQIQSATGLRPKSSRGHTLDGRTYPLLATVAQICGCPGTDWPAHSDAEEGAELPLSYEHHGETSATAPRVAGAALVFKHWYLEQYGAIANEAGRILVNVLHFADGFAQVLSDYPRTRVDPPYPGWGLGRLRMRLYSEAQNDSGPTWASTTVVVWTGSYSTIDLTNGTGTLPENLRHLRITAWWLEMNTGDGETKAEIELSLSYRDRTGASRTDVVSNGAEHVLRLQYDRDDEQFPCPPSGTVTLDLYAPNVPLEERSRFSTEGVRLGVRVVYIAWSWEYGPDTTDIHCDSLSAAGVSVCHELRGGGVELEDPALGGTAAGSEVHEPPSLRLRREAAERSIRGAWRIAKGLAPSAGASPVRTSF